MDDALPDDEELTQRQEIWENFFKKHSNVQNETEVNLDELSDTIGDNESEPNDTEKENAPEALEVEEPSSQELSQQSPRTTRKELQLAVKERQVVWKKKGLSFTFDKVDEWLKQSEYQNRREFVDPRSGTNMVEETNYKEMGVKRKYRNNRQQQQNEMSELLTESGTESDTDASSNTSVDTAQYIRANQKHRTKKVTKTIIKEYIVTTKRVNHHRPRERYPAISVPLQAITNEQVEDIPKKKNRKTKHQLNKRRRKTQAQSSDDDSSSSDEISNQRPKKRKIPLAKLRALQTEPIYKPQYSNTSSRKTEGLISDHKSNMNTADKQPIVVLSKIPSETIRTILRGTDPSVTPVIESGLNETTEKSSGHQVDDVASISSRSRTPSVLNMSRRSWMNFPKKVVIYEPELNTTNEKKVTITNEHFEKAIGVEAAQDFFQTSKFEKEIDAESTVVLERPSTDDEMHSSKEDSDIDVLDYFTDVRPKLTIIPMDKS